MRPSDVVGHGLRNYCPFCAAMTWSGSMVGTRVVMLSGYRYGEVAQVVDVDEDPDVLICKFDLEPGDWTYRENRRHELILPERLFLTPDWAPPISVEDAGFIHQAMLLGYAAAIQRADKDPRSSMLQEFVVSVWRRRLPLEIDDVWPMLAAHGFGDDEAIVARCYAFGLGLLVFANGRGPVKRKRMAPFDSFKYQPSRRVR